MSTFPFEVGDIVALKSHPYSEELHNVLISGDPLSITPLMVILEVVKEKTQYHEHTGLELNGKFKCRCYWYSQNTSKFEEKWVNWDMIKLIKKKHDKIQKEELNPGTLITLKTHEFEAAKKKISNRQEDTFRNDKISISQTESSCETVVPFLTFTPPVMQVCSIKQNDSKDPIFDKKEGYAIRKRSNLLVKCQWFNSSLNKFSEEYFPVEALQLFTELPSDQTLNQLNTTIQNGLWMSYHHSTYTTILRPQEINFSSGKYFMRGFDYLKNRIKSLELTTSTVLNELKKPFTSSFPEKGFTKDFFEDENLDDFFIKEAEATISNAKTDKKYIRILYQNRKGRLTTRTIKEFDLSKYELTLKSGEKKEIPYLIGHCLLKEEERTFKLDRIQRVETLDLNF